MHPDNWRDPDSDPPLAGAPVIVQWPSDIVGVARRDGRGGWSSNGKACARPKLWQPFPKPRLA